MTKYLLGAAVVCLGMALFAKADDAVINATFADMSNQVFEHGDLDPWKGSATVYVLNDTDEAWGDFHLKVFSVNGSNISATIFVDGGAYDPTSTQTLDSWSIDNDPAGAQMDLYYYGDPVQPGELAMFKVYTDNTTYKQRFGLSIWPSPVPEPATLGLLSLGLLGLLRRRTA